jgi:hypothetical protein
VEPEEHAIEHGKQSNQFLLMFPVWTLFRTAAQQLGPVKQGEGHILQPEQFDHRADRPSLGQSANAAGWCQSEYLRRWR